MIRNINGTSPIFLSFKKNNGGGGVNGHKAKHGKENIFNSTFRHIILVVD